MSLTVVLTFISHQGKQTNKLTGDLIIGKLAEVGRAETLEKNQQTDKGECWCGCGASIPSMLGTQPGSRKDVAACLPLPGLEAWSLPGGKAILHVCAVTMPLDT